jgi:hypothetical protein
MVRTTLIVIALTMGLGVAAPAGAAVLQRAAPRQDIEPALAMGPGGGGLAWRSWSSVRFVALDAHGRPRGPVRTLARNASSAANASIAVDLRGNVVVAWSARVLDRSRGRCCQQVWATTVTRDGRVSPADPLSPAGEGTGGARVAIGAGRAVVVWSGDEAIEASSARAGRRFSAPVDLGSVWSLAPVASAVGPHGTATVLLSHSDLASGTGAVDQLAWSSGGAPRLTAPLQPPDPGYEARWVFGADGSRLLIGRTGQRPAVWIASPIGPWSSRRLGPAGTQASAAVGPDGTAAAAFSGGSDPTHVTISVAWSRGGRRFTAARLVGRTRSTSGIEGSVVRGAHSAFSLYDDQRARVALAHRGGAGRIADLGAHVRAREPAIALVPGHVLVAVQTRRGLELRRGPDA